MSLLAACSTESTEDKRPFRAPIWGEPPGDKIRIDDNPLNLEGGDFRDGNFNEHPFQGYLLTAGSRTRIDLNLKAVTRGDDPVLIVYGPRSNGDVWGAPIAVDDDGGRDLDARLSDLGFPGRGEYLVLVSSNGRSATGDYQLTLECNEGCQIDPCPAVACGDVECNLGFETAANGCQTCVCLDECTRDADCGPNALCVDSRCQDSCQSGCLGPYEPVCGSDGVTYPSRCDASCAGVQVTAPEACNEECPELSCPDVECENGFKRDELGCPTCECQSPCDSCDMRVDRVCTRNGRTYTNACLAECNGETVEHGGACTNDCGPIDCEVDCPEGYRRGDDGCPVCECRVGCGSEFEPVCGINGVTYDSACEANDAGVAIVYEDPCPPLCDPASGGQDPDNLCPDGLVCTQVCVSAANPDGNMEEGGCIGVCAVDENQATPCEDPNGDGTAACPIDTECIDGECVNTCLCSPVWDPVCSGDNVTYRNECTALCNGAQNVRAGACCDESALDQCGLQCDYGYQSDADGCAICECRQEPCECDDVENPVCGSDGVVYRNRCEALCAGVEVIGEPGDDNTVCN